MTLEAETITVPQPLAYATASTEITLADLKPALGWLLGVAILSGLCVGSCFLMMANPLLGGAVHLLIYAAILFIAVCGGIALGKAGFSRPGLLTLDGVAGLGLLMIGLVPLGLWLFPRDVDQTRLGAFPLALAFALLSLTSVRHYTFYRKLSYPVQAVGYRKTAVMLRSIGWVKAVFETIWLACCTVPLLAVGTTYRPRGGDEEIILYFAVAAFVGCLVYAPVWIVMIVLHARLLRLASLRQPAGFDVILPESSATLPYTDERI